MQPLALEAQHQTKILYETESQLVGEPQAPQIRRAVQNIKPKTQKQANAIVESFERPAVDPTAQEQLRANIRARLGNRGRSSHPHDEEMPAQSYQDMPSQQYQQQDPYGLYENANAYRPPNPIKNLGKGYNGTGMSLDYIASLSGIGSK